MSDRERNRGYKEIERKETNREGERNEEKTETHGV